MEQNGGLLNYGLLGFAFTFWRKGNRDELFFAHLTQTFTIQSIPPEIREAHVFSVCFHSFLQQTLFGLEGRTTGHFLNFRKGVLNFTGVVMNNSSIEGDWGDFAFRLADTSYYPIILDHLRATLYTDEPLNVLAGNSLAKQNELDYLAIQFMEENLSFFVIHKPTNKVVGVRIMREMSRDARAPNMDAFKSPELQKMVPFCLRLQEEVKVFDKLGVDEMATLVTISVDREFRNQGLGTEMYKRSIQLLKEKGCAAVDGCFTNKHAIRIAQKLGFSELGRAFPSQYEDEKGDKVFPDADPEYYIALMTLKLQN